MADTVKISQTLRIDTLFVDGDTRVITLKNPKESISSDKFRALNAFMQENNIIIGDRAGGTFGKIKEVRSITEQRVELDI